MEKADTWDDVARTMRRGCVWGIRILQMKKIILDVKGSM
jgi:hypothetical protein